MHFPIRAIRIITDPIVDSFMFVASRLLGPIVIRAVHPCLAMLSGVAAKVIGENGTDEGMQAFMHLVRPIRPLICTAF